MGDYRKGFIDGHKEAEKEFNEKIDKLKEKIYNFEIPEEDGMPCIAIKTYEFDKIIGKLAKLVQQEQEMSGGMKMFVKIKVVGRSLKLLFYH